MANCGGPRNLSDLVSTAVIGHIDESNSELAMYKNIVEYIQDKTPIDIDICNHPGCTLYNIYHKGLVYMGKNKSIIMYCNQSFKCNICYCEAHVELHLKRKEYECMDGTTGSYYICEPCEQWKKNQEQ